MKKLLNATIFLFLSGIASYLITNATFTILENYRQLSIRRGSKLLIDLVSPAKQNNSILSNLNTVKRTGSFGFPSEKLDLIEKDTTGNMFLIIIISICTIVLLMIILRRYIGIRKKERDKKKSTHLQRKNMNSQPFVSTMNNITTKSTNESISKGVASTNFEKDNISLLLEVWESTLKNDEKKFSTETINEWFRRINGPKEIIPIYEKVRYGKKKYSEDEYVYVKSQLKQ